MTNPTRSEADRLKTVLVAAQPVIDRLHELLGAGWSDEQIQNTLGRWMQAVDEAQPH